MFSPPQAVYQVAHAWSSHVISELGPSARLYGPLALDSRPCRPCAWASGTWGPVSTIRYRDLADAARQLSSLAPGPWSFVPWTLQDEGRKLLGLLKATPTRPLDFPPALAPIGGPVFSIFDRGTLIASPWTSNPFPGGPANFRPNRSGPPSSAYLKLQEALVRLGWYPDQTSRCLDAGACPGGWTWVLVQQGAHVTAIDRSPLDPALMAHPRVSFVQGNAFSPRDLGPEPLDLVCSDVICYPEALWTWFERLLAEGAAKHYVLTIKMKGQPDWPTLRRFQAVEGGRVFHGHHNKHEVTFMFPAPLLPDERPPHP